MSEKLRVAVLFGGRSGEHEVSLNSAASVISALDPDKYHIIPIGITKEGSWRAGVGPQEVLEKGGFGPDSFAVTLIADPTKQGLVKISSAGETIVPWEELAIQVVFPVLHGTFGEDGTIQGLLELANIPYVGAGVAASAVGMDKILMKTVFAQHGLPQASYLPVLRKNWEQSPQQVVQKVEKELGYPCFVKPANLGSSVGITKAQNQEELQKAMDLAAKYDRKIIVEEHINAREIEISVLGNDEPQASIPGEIVPSNEFYDYEAKYLDGKTQLIIPAQLPPETVQEMQQLAVRAFKAIDCAGLARVDFFLTKDTGRVLVNEINTIPGFTIHSMYPKLWEASGIPYSQLVDRLIELALERHADKNRSLTSYGSP